MVNVMVYASIESTQLYDALCRKMMTWGLSQKETAKRLGIAEQEVSDILHGKLSSWSPKRFREVSYLLGLIVIN